ncbi:MAG TPA: SDR family NAD(P)-dependent oxidoreductase [Acidiferrobacterales bacterium]|nr:SDR family NAD(P)-dependent oxidoreductase [Acidiferrobacterales bacterium]
MASDRFAGKVAIVTAAGAGIGRAIALEWARGGGTAALADKDKSAVEPTAQEIAALNATALAIDGYIKDAQVPLIMPTSAAK